MYEREDDSFLMNASTPSGRPIRVIWRFDRDPDEIPDVFGEVADDVIFVVTAYGGGN